jgi:hypothetical protein
MNTIGTVEEEADETALWIEYLRDLNIVSKGTGEPIIKEVYEV